MNQKKITKRIFTLGILFTVITIISSCDDWIDRMPTDGLIRDEYWQNKENVESVLMGAYSDFARMDERLFLYGELRGDMIETNSGSGVSRDIQEIEEANIFSDNSLCDWSIFYSIINLCNHVIKYSPEVLQTDDTFSEYESLSLISEALYLRSLTYFYLIRIFKDVPLILEPTDSDGVDFFPEKSKDLEIIEQIESDLTIARKTARSTYGNNRDDNGRATRGAMDILMADIALWKAALATTAAQADSAYNACLSHIQDFESADQAIYVLLGPSNWFENFYPGNSVENIFEFQNDQGLGQSNTMFDYTWTNNYFSPTEYSLELLLPEFSNEMIRGRGSVSIEYSNSGYKIFKYYGSAPDQTSRRVGTEARSCNWLVYRYAEVLLMKAEALTQRSNPDFQQAEDLINELRYRAGVKFVSPGYSRQDFEDAILDERGRELAFEGKRWFDLLRMGLRNNQMRKNVLIERIILKVPSTQKLVLASKLTDPNGWYLPIYENEIERNDKLIQNPFYGDETF